MTQKIAGCLAVAVLALLPPRPAAAAELTFVARGTVTSVHDDGGNVPAAWGSPVSAGDAFALEYTFETTAPDTNADPRLGWYRGLNRWVRVTAGEGTAAFVPTRDEISVANDFPERPPEVVDQYYVRADNFGSGPVTVDAALQIGAETAAPIALLTSDLLPLVPPDFAAYAGDPDLYVVFFLILRDDTAPTPWMATVEARLESFTASPPPALAFVPPVRAGAVNVAKAGAAIPIKFTACDAQGACACDLARVLSAAVARVDCPGAAPASGRVAATGRLKPLRCEEGQYQLLWKTEKAAAGECFRFTARLRDGAELGADFLLR